MLSIKSTQRLSIVDAFNACMTQFYFINSYVNCMPNTMQIVIQFAHIRVDDTSAPTNTANLFCNVVYV